MTSFSTVIDTLNTLRNHGSVAHPNQKLIEPTEAQLVVNAVRTIFHYLSHRLGQQSEQVPWPPPDRFVFLESELVQPGSDRGLRREGLERGAGGYNVITQTSSRIGPSPGQLVGVRLVSIGAVHGFVMKSKVIRLDTELQQAAEAVLRKDESLSELVEASLRENITHRQAQKEFLARGIAGRDEARRTGKYVDAPEVLAKLDAILLTKQNGRNPE